VDSPSNPVPSESNSPPADSSDRTPPAREAASQPAGRMAIAAARVADELRCEDVVILDLRGLSPVTDFFVIATGTSNRQLRAVAEAIDEKAAAMGHRQYGRSGYEHAAWVLIDYVDIVVHLFDEPSRAYYDLELLWGDAPRFEWHAKPEE